MGLDDDPTRESVSAMLQAADARLYAAKHAGRNRIVA
jgi:PleD family two-component response regulator